MLDREVVSDGAGLADRKDTGQVLPLGTHQLSVTVAPLRRPDRETDVEVTKKLLFEVAVCSFDRHDAPQPEFFDEPVLQRAEEPLDPPFGLGRVRMDGIDAELLHGTLELGYCFRIVERGLCVHLVGRVFIKVDGRRFPVLFHVRPPEREDRHDALVGRELRVGDPAGGVINSSKEAAGRRSLLKPRMVGAIELHHLAKGFLPGTPGAVLAVCATRTGLPEASADHDLPDGFPAETHSMALQKLLGREGRLEVSVVPAEKIDGAFLRSLRRPPVARLAAVAVDKAFGAALRNALLQVPDMAHGEIESTSGFSASELPAEEALDDFVTREFTHGESNAVLHRSGGLSPLTLCRVPSGSEISILQKAEISILL